MFATYELINSPYNKFAYYNYNIDELPKNEEWMNDCIYCNYRMILKDKKKLDVSYIDCELIKYCLDQLEEFNGTIMNSTYRGTTIESTESIFYKIICKSKNLINIKIKHINLIDIDILSKHLILENIDFKIFDKYEINHTEYKRDKPLYIKTNKCELLELNNRYNKLNIFFTLL